MILLVGPCMVSMMANAQGNNDYSLNPSYAAPESIIIPVEGLKSA